MKCERTGCTKEARYIVGEGKMKLCINCFDEYVLPKDKVEHYKNKLVKVIKKSKRKDEMELCYGCTWNDGIYESAHCLSCKRNPKITIRLDDNWESDD